MVSPKKQLDDKNRPTFIISSKRELGNYLADAEGRALYYFGKSNMESLKNIDPISDHQDNQFGIWQIFYEEKIIPPAPLKAKNFYTIVRPDEQKQTAYKGHPLYYYANDLNPGEVKGEGINNTWFTVKIN